MDGFPIRGWELILPGYGGTSALTRGATLARAGSMSPSQSSITQWGWGLHILSSHIVENPLVAISF